MMLSGSKNITIEARPDQLDVVEETTFQERWIETDDPVDK
jgi:hypothetical protein